uniref:Uncharacterized protein n=1 Tax=Leersia perrieri TaxID=77586 RepID=A0A0D9W7V7_9ORYZ
MAPAPGGVRGRGGGRGGGEEEVRKGPWSEEEDEVLREHVRTHGPREWSSIRSKVGLPRTGKSCRLRWVNKLRPNLKSCKFTANEEREVIELQARYGNKWARIATHLQGRTDNDVKNFWSTRQKRLARLLRVPLCARSKKQKNSSRGKALASFPKSEAEPETAMVHQGSACLNQASLEGNSSYCQYSEAAPFVKYQNVAQAPYDQACAGSFAFKGALPPLAAGEGSSSAAGEVSSSNAAQLAPLMLFDHPAYPRRLLRTPVNAWSDTEKNSNKGKEPSSSLESETAMIHQDPTYPDQASFEGYSFGCQCYEDELYVDYWNAAQAHDPAWSGSFSFEGAQELPQQLLPPAAGEASSSSAAQFAPPLPFDHPGYPLINFPGVSHALVGAMNDLTFHEMLPMMQSAPMIVPFVCMEFAHGAVKDEPRDAFNDLPPVMSNDTVDQLPPAPPPSPASSGDEF